MLKVRDHGNLDVPWAGPPAPQSAPHPGRASCARQGARMLVWCGAVLLALAGCGGGDVAIGPPAASQSEAMVPAARLTKLASEPTQASTLGELGALSIPAADPGLLLLLLPDDYTVTDSRVASWVDAARELGVRIAPITDSQFMGLGEGMYGYAGLVLPDDLHSVATDSLIAAINSYVSGGGNALLSFDFGALTRNAEGQPVYPIPKSRLSDLAGVDYVLYDELLDRTTGLGPVTATRSMMRTLQVPPGKSMPFTVGGSLTTLGLAAPQGLLGSPTELTAVARYLPTTTVDPGGVRGFDPQQFQDVRPLTARQLRSGQRRNVAVDWGGSKVGEAVAGVTRARAAPARKQGNADQAGTLSTAPLRAEAAETLDAYSGYIYGFLVYPSYVTRGIFDGLTMATSPQHGLVAGLRSHGSGKVLFVNLPLTYLKGRTDALLMHGFLSYFAFEVLRLPNLSPMPRGIPGMVLNWHFDSMEAQQPSLALEKAGVFNRGPYSIDFTAGPDTVQLGDGLGWNLDNNPVAQDLLRRLAGRGHSIGSHGGWAHDYFGLNATEENQASFEQYLVMNKESVDRVVGRPGRDYAAPEGNNPNWAMEWLERNGVVAAYFGGHTGLGVTRQYRDGILKTPNLWVVPVTPQGVYATFEEFQEFSIPKTEVIAWYHELVDFTLQNNTNRMIYMHPPGAYDWLDVLQDLLAYTASKPKYQFRWYSMPQLADFSAQRLQVQWTQTVQADGSVQFNASHPTGLADMVWRLPKSRFLKPVVRDKAATVRDSGLYWTVRPNNVTTVQFSAAGVK